jgi:hypothetical protein
VKAIVALESADPRLRDVFLDNSKVRPWGVTDIRSPGNYLPLGRHFKVNSGGLDENEKDAL